MGDIDFSVAELQNIMTDLLRKDDRGEVQGGGFYHRRGEKFDWTKGGVNARCHLTVRVYNADITESELAEKKTKTGIERRGVPIPSTRISDVASIVHEFMSQLVNCEIYILNHWNEMHLSCNGNNPADNTFYMGHIGFENPNEPASSKLGKVKYTST